jgi:hypothetical protein
VAFEIIGSSRLSRCGYALGCIYADYYQEGIGERLVAGDRKNLMNGEISPSKEIVSIVLLLR